MDGRAQIVGSRTTRSNSNTIQTSIILAENPNLRLDVETAERVHKGYQGCSEFIQLLTNEPSIGLYFVCDHIRLAVPKILEVKKDMKRPLQEISYDVDFSRRELKALHGLETFANIQSLLATSISLGNTYVQTRDNLKRVNTYPRSNTLTSTGSSLPSNTYNTESSTSTSTSTSTSSTSTSSTTPTSSTTLSLVSSASSTPTQTGTSEFSLTSFDQELKNVKNQQVSFKPKQF